MTSYPRTRTRIAASIGAGYGLSVGPVADGSIPTISGAVMASDAVSYEDSIQDYVSDSLPWPDHPLTSVQYGRLAPALAQCYWLTRSNVYSPPRYSLRFASGIRLLPNSNYGLEPTILPNWTDLQNQCLSRFDPNTPIVDVPRSILELIGDFPRMLKNAGDLLRNRHGPGDYVAWEFGWKPLLDDLRKMLAFQKNVDTRLAQLKKLRAPSSQRIELGRRIGTASLNNVARGPVRYSVQRRTVMTQWGVFTHQVDLDRLPSFPTRDDAASLAYSTSIDAATLWELIPWSWFFDWFADVGSYLALSRNRIPYLVSNLTMMVKSETTETLTSVSYNSTPLGVTVEKTDNFEDLIGRSVDVVKRQRVVKTNPRPGVAIHLPFLTVSQWGILGSISTSRYKFRL